MTGLTASAAWEQPGCAGIGDSWRTVSRFLIRSAGFPFGTTDFGVDQVSRALARRAELRAEAAALRAQWPACFDGAVRALERAGADRCEFKALYRARREVAQDRPIPPAAAEHLDAAWAQDWKRCLGSLDTAERELDEVVRTVADHGRGRLRTLLADRRFFAALTVSNPELAGRLRRSLMSDPAGLQSSTRQDERVVYAYAQRFATKNETISFFGPVDYGSFGGADTVRLRYARQPVQHCWIRLSHWAVQLLADRIGECPDIAGHLPLRVRDGCMLTAQRTLLIATTGRRVLLRPAQAEVLDLVTSAGVTAGELMSRLADPSAALDLLSRQVITCRPLVPTALDDPASWLLGLLADLRRKGIAAAAPWHDRISTLIDGLVGITKHDDRQRLASLAQLETRFTEISGQPARRGAGEHYADRLLITEDCRGGVAECVVPAEQATALVRRLSPTLRLCASYSLLVQRAVLTRALARYAELARRGPVGYLQFIAELDRTMSIEDATADPAVTGWLNRFDQIVSCATTDPAGVARVGSAALAPLLNEPPAGLVVSPDIFLGADPSEVDIERTEVIIGEIHHGAQVWSHLSLFDPDQAATGDEVAAVSSAGGELAALLCRRTQGKAFERELPGPVVQFRAAAAQRHPTVLPAENLSVQDVDGALRLTAPDGAEIRLHARHPRSPSNWLFGPPPVVAPVPLRTAEYAPRVLIGDVVAWRARWRLDSEQLGELAARHPGVLVRSAADLRARLGLPRLIFARAQSARKPVFADLECPTSLQHLAHYLRKSSTAELTEMMPEPRQWWLRPAGHPVSCEWRLTLGWAGSSGLDT
ncbi:MAG TPA: lantibiotic dehydratase [Pseudonocardiaceae bacterium]|nr:lantibiotic dehydratase [Pseudonocardiaceae bacterium]